ncbi:MAG: ATP-binding protein [Oscillospiraceae bacterium]
MDIETLRREVLSVCIYNKVWSNDLLAAIKALLFCDEQDDMTLIRKYSALFSAAFEADCVISMAQYIQDVLLLDDNKFTRALSAQTPVPKEIYNAVNHELEVFGNLAMLDTNAVLELFPGLKRSETILPQIRFGKIPPLFAYRSKAMDFLDEYHRNNGCGIFSTNYAFIWDGKIVPVENIDTVTLHDLKSYELPRSQVIDNTEAFLDALPASNMLLYGDKGTGKSSTIHAILNEYHPKGLRMLELQREDLHNLSKICGILGSLPLKFIIFIDDLSFDGWSEDFSALKAVLEGSLAARPQNVLIYATSNRRHLVREYHSDRTGDDVNSADTMQEMLSLSDRFGITVTFLNPLKAQYLEITQALAADAELNISRDELCLAAERWAISKAGRSPRTAKQFIDYAKSKLSRGLEL